MYLVAFSISATRNSLRATCSLSSVVHPLRGGSQATEASPDDCIFPLAGKLAALQTHSLGQCHACIANKIIQQTSATLSAVWSCLPATLLEPQPAMILSAQIHDPGAAVQEIRWGVLN